MTATMDIINDLFPASALQDRIARLDRFKRALEWLEKNRDADNFRVSGIVHIKGPDNKVVSADSVCEVLERVVWRRLAFKDIVEDAIEHCRQEIERLRQVIKDGVEKL